MLTKAELSGMSLMERVQWTATLIQREQFPFHSNKGQKLK